MIVKANFVSEKKNIFEAYPETLTLSVHYEYLNNN